MKHILNEISKQEQSVSLGERYRTKQVVDNGDVVFWGVLVGCYLVVWLVVLSSGRG